MKEECEEAWDEIKKKDHKRDKKNLVKELVQTAAMCFKTAEVVNRIPKKI